MPRSWSLWARGPSSVERSEPCRGAAGMRPRSWDPTVKRVLARDFKNATTHEGGTLRLQASYSYGGRARAERLSASVREWKALGGAGTRSGAPAGWKDLASTRTPGIGFAAVTRPPEGTFKRAQARPFFCTVPSRVALLRDRCGLPHREPPPSFVGRLFAMRTTETAPHNER